MSKTLVLVLAAFVVLACGIEEIQELGNNDEAAKSVATPEADDELGEGVGGRGGASLSTTGSFTLSSGSHILGNTEEDELGEGVGGRGGVFLSTTGSFTLSSGSNILGNTEEDELGEGVGGRGGAFLS